ncbi:HAD phosphatase [Cristinia sonorae]|uniref:HAD phosphatase n=1 Tax=Cristinia sonorae TaxID=1940300 RepID=A0A8K0XSX2_9AGAR|nr:HAD phosphatase [Cristinia sonorae]
MPLNIPGILVPLHLLVNPRLVLPAIIIKDIRQLDFRELYRAGYRGAVFDKDNCLTIPYKDQLVPELHDAWKECREVFGDGNVLIVSNSAGTRLDPGGIQAESVSHYLSVPVLQHSSLKPSYSCIGAIRKYFASLPTPVKDEELIVVGDRIFTDVVLANRMSRWRRLPHSTDVVDEKEDDARNSRRGPLAIWTTGVWEKESMAMRYLENLTMQGIHKLVHRGAAGQRPSEDHYTRFVKPLPPPDVSGTERGWISKVFASLRRT